MYLSRLMLNPNNRQVWRQHLRNPYKIHQLVMRGFPDETKRCKTQVLHRLEERDDVPVLMVQSALEPDWSGIDLAYLIRDPFDPWPNPAVRPLNLSLRVKQIFNFRLCANPTIKKVRRDEQGTRRNSNRVPLFQEDQQKAWLKHQAEEKGFEVLDVAIRQEKTQKIWKARNTPPLTLYTVQFDGYLKVLDPDKLLAGIQQGIGPARAFGCGLLSLGRIQ